MEIATDEQTMSYIENTEYKAYGLALINALDSFRTEAFTPKLLGMVSDGNIIKIRIKKIEKFKRPKVLWSVMAILLIAVISGVCLTNAKSLGLVPRTNEDMMKNTQMPDNGNEIVKLSKLHT